MAKELRTLLHIAMELVLPIPKEPATRDEIIRETRRIVETRAELRRYNNSVLLENLPKQQQSNAHDYNRYQACV